LVQMPCGKQERARVAAYMLFKWLAPAVAGGILLECNKLPHYSASARVIHQMLIDVLYTCLYSSMGLLPQKLRGFCLQAAATDHCSHRKCLEKTQTRVWSRVNHQLTDNFSL
jgi:hypothetical protein